MAEIWPKGVAKPAIRALNSAGYTEIQQLVNVEVKMLRALHGMGPKALAAIQEELQKQGFSLKLD